MTYEIKNKGITSFRFFISQTFNESFQLEILNAKGEDVQSKLTITSDRQFFLDEIQPNKIQNLAGNTVKEIVLHPGESFKKTFFIQNLQEGNYKIIGYFIPYSYDEKYKRHLKFISQNALNVSIKTQTFFSYDDEVLAISEPIPAPEEVIYLFLMAEYHKEWEKYLKYIDIKEFIQSYDIFYRKYEVADSKKKQKILYEFKNYLISGYTDEIKSFKILKTEYLSPNLAKVSVEVLRASYNYKVLYHYEYFLSKKDFWLIQKVLVTIIKK